MSGTLGLTALNKSSCKVATFAVRMFGGAVGSYTYKSRSNGADCTMYKFEAILIGTDASAYLRGYVKGTAAQAREASKKFGDGSCWLLSKTVLDSFTNAAFISTPVPHRVDLAKSTLTPASLDTLPTHPVPPRTVADLAVITTNRSTDLLAVIKEASELRLSSKGVPIVDVTLIDGSTLPTGSTAGASQPGAAKATIVVSVWGVDKAKQMQAHVGDAMEFFGLAVSMKEGKKQINHFAARNPSLRRRTAPRPLSSHERRTSSWQRETPRCLPANGCRTLWASTSAGPNPLVAQLSSITRPRPPRHTSLQSSSFPGCSSRSPRGMLP